MGETKKPPEVVLHFVNEPTEEEVAEMIEKRNRLLEAMGYIVPTDGGKIRKRTKSDIEKERAEREKEAEQIDWLQLFHEGDGEEKTGGPANAERRQAQSAISLVYQRIELVVRDVNLPDHIANRYIPGMIIHEEDITRASERVMGMVTTHRYIILSNHMLHFPKDPQDNHDPDWGLCVMGSNSHFKVLGRHTYKDKHAIILLHLPDDDTWKMFENVDTPMDQRLVELAVKRFEAKCELPPVPELTTPRWLDLCKSPVGMSDR